MLFLELICNLNIVVFIVTQQIQLIPLIILKFFNYSFFDHINDSD